VAKINPVKVKQDADKFEKAGKLDQAITLYRQLVEDNPRDWNTINKIGDLYAKLNKIKEASGEYAKVADFYARDGFLLKAIAIWKKINKLDPTVLDPYVNLADLYGKQGLMMEAKSQYQIVVDEYVKRNKMREAGDVLKKMAEIDPADLKVRSRLADLYTREGNSAKAVEEHIAIAEELNKKGHLAEAVQVLEKGLKIDSKSHRLRLELGRIHLVQKNHERAAHFLEEAVQQSPNDPKILVRLGEAYLGAKKIEEAEAIFKRLLELEPNDQESRIQMGRVYLMQGQFEKSFDEFQPIVDKLLERRDGEKAAALLQQIVQKNPQHVRTLQKLVDIYRMLQKEAAVTQTYSQLTEAFINHGQYEQAAAVLEVLVSLEPQNQQHKAKLQMVRSKGPGTGKASTSGLSSSALAEAEDIDEEFDIAPLSDPEPASRVKLEGGRPAAPPRPSAVPSRPAPAAPARPTIELSGPLSNDDSEFIEEHLAEGRVFRKYGLIDKAADQFEAIVARFPDHAEARQELRDLYREKGMTAKAAEHGLALAEIYRLKGDSAGAAAAEEEARQIAPELAPASRASPAAKAKPKPVEEEEEEITIGGSDEDVLLEVEESGLESPNVALGGAMSNDALLDDELGKTGQFGDRFIEEEEEISIPEPSAHDDIEIAVEDAPPEIAASNSSGFEMEEAPLTFEQEEEVLTFDEPEPAIAAPPPRAPAPRAPAPVAPPVASAPPPALRTVPEAAPGLPTDLQKLIDEVDSYVSLGFVDDAREALREVRNRYPSHPAVLAKVAELGLSDEPEEEVAPPPRPAARPAPPPPPPPKPPVARPAPPPPPAPRVAPPPPARVAPPPPPPPEPEPEADIDLPGFDSGPDLDLPMDDPFAEPTAAHGALSDDPLSDLGLDMPEPEPEPIRAPPPPMRAKRPAPPPPPPPEPEPFDDFPPPVEVDEPALPDMDVPIPDLSDEPSPAYENDPMSVEDLVGGFGAAPGDNHSGELDIGDELGELFETQSAVAPVADSSATELGDAGLAEIFKEFKAGVDRQLGKEDYDTRYNLGIAYKEMGLVDEAIAEFQLAAKDETRQLECSSMLGLCFMEKGMPKLAIKWFERGLKTRGRMEEEYLGLRYDLAAAYEAAGDTDTALGMYTDLWGQNAGFRDVAEKVRELGGG
jgi:tetratricopeptide (TPR) repeat protein